MLKSYFKKVKEKDHLRRKEGIISSVIMSITEKEYNPTEQAEIVNRIMLGVFDKTKEGRQRHIQEARAYQEGLEKLNLNSANG